MLISGSPVTPYLTATMESGFILTRRIGEQGYVDVFGCLFFAILINYNCRNRLCLTREPMSYWLLNDFKK